MENKYGGLIAVIIAILLIAVGIFSWVWGKNQVNGTPPDENTQEVVSDGLIYTSHLTGWSVSVPSDYSGSELVIPSEHQGKPVLKISDFPALPLVKKLTIQLGSDQLAVNGQLVQNLTGLNELTLSGGKATLKSGFLSEGSSLRVISLQNGSFTLEDRCISDNGHLEALTLESVTLNMGAYSGFYTLSVDTMTVRGTTVSLSATKLLEGLTTMKVGTLYLGNGGNVSADSLNGQPVDRLILEEDFSASNSSATLRINKVFYAEQAPLATEIHIPASVTSLPDNFFGQKGDCTVYYEGLASDFDTVTVSPNGNAAYFNGNVNIYGKEHTDIDVIFHAQNGEDPVEWSVRYGHKVTRLEDPVRSGYVFMGWFTEAEGGDPWNFEEYTVTTPVTLYAHWLSLADFGECEVLESHGFSLSSDTEVPYYYAVADKDTHTMDVSNSFTLSEYATFTVRAEGGDTDLPVTALPLTDGENRFTMTVTSGNGENRKTYTLVIFRSYICTVIFDDGVTKIAVETEIGEALEERSAVREGYDFTGWYLGDTKWDFATHRVTGNVTLTAGWKGKTYRVSLQGVGEKTVTYGESYSFAPATQMGYTFNGWKTENGIFFTDENGDSLVPWSLTEGVTLVPDFSLITYRVTYENLGGALNPNPATHGGDTPLTLQAPERIGYEFLGWMRDGEAVESIPAGQEGDVTLTATWQVITYTITFENTKDQPVDAPTTYTVEDAVTLPELTADGLTFLGWFKDGVELDSIPKGTVGDMTLRAKWLGDTYSVTYIGLEGTTHNNPATYEYGLGITLTEPVRTGYRFLGWYRNGEKVESIPGDNRGSVVLTAMWEIHTFTVTFVDLQGDGLYTETVPYGGAVQNPPEPPSVYRKIFVSWSYNINIVSSDMTVTPVYKEHTHSVIFDTDGKQDVATQNPYYGENAVKPADPINGEYSFEGWYLPSGELYDFSYPLNGDTTLTAVWRDYTPIYEAEDLYLMEGSDGKFRLMNNINFYGEPFTPIQKFSGSLDGGGHTISSFTLGGGEDLGMIITNEGTVKNLTVTDVILTHSPGRQDTSLALLVVKNTGTIENCRLTDCALTMTKNCKYRCQDTGLLCANNEGIIRDCQVSDCTAELHWQNDTRGTTGGGSQTTTVTFGVIVGRSTGAEESCVAEANVKLTVPHLSTGNYLNDTTQMYLGGIVGCTSGTVKNCSSALTLSGTIDGGDPLTDVRVGGIAGSVQGGEVQNSTALATITLEHIGSASKAGVHLGGAVGYTDTDARVYNCAAYGSIQRNAVTSNTNHVGGFVAYNQGTVYNCYSYTALSLQRADHAAGFCDENTASGIIRSCFALGYFYVEADHIPEAFVNDNKGTVRSCYFGEDMKIHTLRERVISVSDEFAQPVSMNTVMTSEFMEKTLNWNPKYWDGTANRLPILKSYPADCMVIVMPNRYEFGQVKMSGVFFDKGDTVTLTATANNTFVFDGWYVKGSNTKLCDEPTYTFKTIESIAFIEPRFKETILYIHTYEDLYKIEQYQLSSTEIHLMDHINCMGAPLPAIKEFYGTFNGDGYAIFNFASTLSSEGETAFILDNYGTVKDLTLSGSVTAAATSGTSKLAFFAVRNHEGGVIENCRALGTVKVDCNSVRRNSSGTVTTYCGSIAAENAGMIRSCSLMPDPSHPVDGLNERMLFDVSYKSTMVVAPSGNYAATANLYSGLIAASNTGYIENCSNEGALFGHLEHAARFENNIVAYHTSGMLHYDIYSRGNMNVYVGGIVGISEKTGVIAGCVDRSAMYVSDLAGTDIWNQYSNFQPKHRGILHSDLNFGGLAGDNRGNVEHSLSEGLISYSSDHINRGGCTDLSMDLTSTIGGIAGKSSGSVSNSSHRGILVATSAQTTYVGGVSGDNAGTLSNCYGGGMIMAEGIADDGKVYMNLKFWEGFGGSRSRHGSVSVGGMTGRNAGGATITNCLSNYRFDEMQNCQDQDSYKTLIVNVLLLPVHIKDAFLSLFETPPQYGNVMQVGTIVGNGQNLGNIQNSYYVKNGEYDYTDGSMLTDDLGALSIEMIRRELYWSITDESNLQSGFEWLMLHDTYPDPDHQGSGSLPMLPTITLIPYTTYTP